jgi:hypothetical protein
MARSQPTVPKVQRLLAILAMVAVACAVPAFASGAGPSAHPNYRLGLAKSCKPHYVKRTVSGLVPKREYVDGKWKQENVRGRYVECAYVTSVTSTTGVAPVTTTTGVALTTTTTLPSVTTTTETQIYDQPVTLEYDSFLSYNETLGGKVYATEDADLNINGQVVSPAAGTVSFYDVTDSLICTSAVPTDYFETVVSCGSGALTVAPPTPILVVYSGTQVGYDDGHGTSYAGASAEG